MGHEVWTVKAADEAATVERKAAAKTANVPMKECPKCGGRGIIPAVSHVLGGECFLCSGSGEVAVNGAAKKLLEKKLAEIEITRLRRCWLAMRAAVREAEAALANADAVRERAWALKEDLRQAKANLARYEEAGKAAVAAS